MTWKTPSVVVAAMLVVASLARGEQPLAGTRTLAPSVRAAAKPLSAGRAAPPAILPAEGLFRPLAPDEVFAAVPDRVIGASSVVRISRAAAPGRLVAPRFASRFWPAGPGAITNNDAWDGSRVILAEYASDELGGSADHVEPLRLPSALQEEVPPPVPEPLDWINRQAIEGVTLGQIEPVDRVDPVDPSLAPSEPVTEETLLPGTIVDRDPTDGASIDGIVLDGAPPGSNLIVLPGGVVLPQRTRLAARLGYWTVDYEGNPAKVGEYQSLKSSPFLDIDGLHTDGVRSLDFYGSVLDRDAQQGGFRYYGPSYKARLDYEGYLRRLDRDPFDYFVDFDQQPPRPLPGPPANYRDMKEDLTVGNDFAIRVQQLNTSFGGQLSEHLKWRLNVWGMRKHGQRQASAMAHCFVAPNATDTNGNPVTGPACHILSQSQRIDWLTGEIEPVIEAKYGPVTVEYSRTMRTLNTDDQRVTRPYDGFGFNGELPYAMVPENITEIDRLKVGVALPENRHGYARLYTGHTQNELRDIDREFRGYDLRCTDQSVAGLSLTGYVKNYVQTTDLPRVLLPEETMDSIRAPIDFDRMIAGFGTSWQPFYDEWSLRSRLRLSGGYEYRDLKRGNAVFEELLATADNSFTTTNLIHLRASLGWTPTLDTYVRYRLSFIDNPLYAVPIRNTTVNTSLPTQVHGVQFGSTWAPSHVFYLHGMVGINNSWNHTDIANFDNDQYDLVFTAWYAPTARWTVSGGLGFYSNWIDQDITLGSKTDPLTLPWDYGGRSDVVNVGTTYAWTERLTLSGNVDFVRGRNAFGSLAPWPDLWSYSDVNVETTRFAVGGDYLLGPQSSLYLRYQLFDYDDRAGGFDSGRAEMWLLGVNAFF
jgi:hypothetical protein